MIGMTGNRYGISEEAKRAFEMFIFKNSRITSLSHGDCVGADSDAHDIAVGCDLETLIHPPLKTDLRAYKQGTRIYTEKGYLARNRDIVNTTKLLCGFPKLNKETDGGTWYTINYAKKHGKALKIFWPNGRVENFNLTKQT